MALHSNVDAYIKMAMDVIRIKIFIDLFDPDPIPEDWMNGVSGLDHDGEYFYFDYIKTHGFQSIKYHCSAFNLKPIAARDDSITMKLVTFSGGDVRREWHQLGKEEFYTPDYDRKKFVLLKK